MEQFRATEGTLNTLNFKKEKKRPLSKKGGNSWFHAAVGKPGFPGISMFLVYFRREM